MTYERPTYEDKLRDKLEAKPYRPETIAWIGHICRVGHASPETVINLLDVLEEDTRMTDLEARNGTKPMKGEYTLFDHEGEALPPVLERTEPAQADFRATIADL